MSNQSSITQTQPQPPLRGKRLWQQRQPIKYLTGGILLVSLGMLVTTEAEAASFSFTKIADTSTPIPGGTGNFFGLNYPVLDGSDVAFVGEGIGGDGVYTSIDGSLQVVADRTTPIPGGIGNFEHFGLLVALNDGVVAFDAYHFNEPEQQGIYIAVDGSLQVVADTNTPVPGGAGNFTNLFAPVLDNSELVFFGRDSNYQEGIYAVLGDSLQVVADTNTAVPDGTGNFTFFNVPALNNGNIVFRGIGSGVQDGIYADMGGGLRVVADTNTPIPGGMGNFSHVADPAISDGNVVFLSFESSQLPGNGIYAEIDGLLQVVADTNTAVPDGTGNFLRLYNPGISDRNVVFEGIDSSDREGIYINIDGSLLQVIAQDDLLDGKTVSSVAFNRNGLSGDSLVFWTQFTDDSAAIFRADFVSEPPQSVPELSSVLGLLTFSAFGSRSLAKRKRELASR